MRKYVLFMAVLASVLALCGSAFALTLNPNETYTINFATIASNGTVNASAYSTTGVANSSGVVNFSLTGVPDNSSCNFMDVTVVAPAGAPDYSGSGVVRESIIPCPTKGSNMPLGISDVTNSQANALKIAFSAAGKDDPILAVFFFTAVQTSDISPADLITISKAAEQGIVGNGGFINTMEYNHGDIVTPNLGQYRKNIVEDLADPNSGYTKFLKEAASAINNSISEQDMGKASSLILSTLVEATRTPTDTGIHAGWILEGTDAMGNVVLPMITPPLVTSKAYAEIQDTIGSGLSELGEKVAIQKYENAMTLLGATGADVTQFQNAATTLQNSVDAAMANFNAAAFANGTAEDAGVMNGASDDMQNATMQAFNQFQTDIQAPSAAIGNSVSEKPAPSGSMIYGICNALGGGNINNAPTMFDPITQKNSQDCLTALVDMDNSFGMFTWYTQGGKVNWPLNMVILANWISNLKENGGTMSYTRDTTDFDNLANSNPDDMMLTGWAGFCNSASSGNAVNGDPSGQTCMQAGGNWTPGACNIAGYFDSNSCSTAGGTWQAPYCTAFQKQQCNNIFGKGTWVPALSCFGTAGKHGEPLISEGEAPFYTCQQNPYPYWIMFAIQQDIQVVQDTQMNANGNHETAQQSFDSSLSRIANKITGTTDGKTALTNAQQQAIMELMSPPQM